jgi:multidrug transporter EmrE-like cation transporter
MPALAWLVISGIFFAASEFMSKEFVLAPSYFYLISILIVDIVSILAWLPALMQKNQLSITGALWSVISLLITVLLGILIFGERPNLVGIIGIIFAFVAVFLLSIAQL